MNISKKRATVYPAGPGAATFADLWGATVAAAPGRPFLVFLDSQGERRSWTYREFDDIIRRVASGLAYLGLRPGDGVHLSLPNCPFFVAVWLACTRMGCWIVPVDPSSAAPEISRQLARTRPKVCVYATERADEYRNMLADVDVAGLCVDGLAQDVAPAGLNALFPSSGQGKPQDPAWAPSGQDRLAVMFTSGTTSAPKGVVLTQANYHCVATVMAAAARLGPEHRWLVTLPLFHANAQYYCFASAIAVGASVALTARFSASQWVEQARALAATHASLFAAPIRMILARTPAGQKPSDLIHVWFAQSLGEEHHRAFAALAGCLPRQLYGMTETVPIVTFDQSELPSADQIGTPLPSRRAHIVDLVTRTPAPAGEVGMIAVEGRRGEDLFLEYLDDPATTARTLLRTPDGTDLLLTGDLALQTAGGAWKFVGRADDVIKVSGENVSLTEVEAAVAQAPGVLEAAVVPRADKIRDQVPVAYVVPRDPSAPPAHDQLAAWAQANLSKAARPVEWHVIDELPRTSVGKVRRFKLNATSAPGAHA